MLFDFYRLVLFTGVVIAQQFDGVRTLKGSR